MKKSTLHKEGNTIIINDHAKQNRWAIIGIFGITFVNAVLGLTRADFNDLDFLSISWMVLLVLSLIGMLFQLLRKTTIQKVEFSQIEYAKRNQSLGTYTVLLKLKNGKIRDIIGGGGEQESKNTLNKLEEMGIKTKQK